MYSLNNKISYRTKCNWVFDGDEGEVGAGGGVAHYTYKENDF